MIIAKPMDHIEGNALPKDKSVSYICIDSSVPRRSAIIDLVKFKIGKYFSTDNYQTEQTEKEKNEAEGV